MKLNHTNITVGLLKKVLKACKETFKVGVIGVTIQNRHYEPMLIVKRVNIEGTQKFIITDVNGDNVASLLSRGLNHHAGLYTGMRGFITKNLLWSTEETKLKQVGLI